MRIGYWGKIWIEFKKNKMAMAGFIIVLSFFSVAIFAPLLANKNPYIYITKNKTYFPIFVNYSELKNKDLRKEKYKGFKLFPPIKYSYSEYNLDYIVTPPSSVHILGTDEQGRDLAARMIHGTWVSVAVGFIAVFIYISIGIIVGAIAGYYGGVADLIISRIIEIVMCFPSFFLILTILALFGYGLVNVMLVIGFTGWTGIARIVRGEFLRLRESDFVLAAKSTGVRDIAIIFKHILPNALAPVLVSATFGIASTILIESSLSFLGFGVQPPTPSWGQILSQSRNFMDFAWWLTFVPGFAIFLSVTAYNLVGDGLQDAMDPRSFSK